MKIVHIFVHSYIWEAVMAELRRREDYKPFPFIWESCFLCFHLDEKETIVTGQFEFEPVGEMHDLVLNGSKDLEVESIQVRSVHGITYYDVPKNEMSISEDGDYTIHAEYLHGLFNNLRFFVHVKTVLHPGTNQTGEGLYYKDNMIMTQCEPESARKITLFPDRPDVATIFTVKVYADKEKYPVILSNGKLIESGMDFCGHYVLYRDEKKPAYLFALVAADLEKVEDVYVAKSGRRITLEMYAPKEDIKKCKYGFKAVPITMKWMEETYGLEPPDDIHRIVLLTAFNMGAMENKTLNTFNPMCVSGSKDTATDLEILRVMNVVAHEYLHSWIGNTVFIKNFFCLTVKEGWNSLTDQLCEESQYGVIPKIGSVNLLRRRQFQEDNSALAHPPYIAEAKDINAFYSATVYTKSSFIFRMIREYLRVPVFNRVVHDFLLKSAGKAIDLEEQVTGFGDIAGTDLSFFMPWFTQIGTPTLTVKTVEYNSNAKKMCVTFGQKPGREGNVPVPILTKLYFIGSNGESVDVVVDGKIVDFVIVDDWQKEFCFERLSEQPVMSVLDGFSAPVKVEYEQSFKDQELIVHCARDPFTRWDMVNTIWSQEIERVYTSLKNGKEVTTNKSFVSLFKDIVVYNLRDFWKRELISQMLTVPDFDQMVQYIGHDVDPQLLNHAIKTVAGSVLMNTYKTLYTGIFSYYRECEYDVFDRGQVSWRLMVVAFLNLCKYNSRKFRDLAFRLYIEADNYTEKSAALGVLLEDEDIAGLILSTVMVDFKTDRNLITKYLTCKINSSVLGTNDGLLHIEDDVMFDLRDSNHTKDVGRAFAGNSINFRTASGYTAFAKFVLRVDSVNPAIARGLLERLTTYQCFNKETIDSMKEALLWLKKQTLSDELSDVVERGL